MKVYALEVQIKGVRGWTRTYHTSLEDAVDNLSGVIHRDNFEQAILHEASLSPILTYTNPRRPHE